MRTIIASIICSLYTILIFTPFWPPLQAEILHFHNGKKIEGTIDSITQNNVEINTQGKLQTYPKSIIKKIEYNNPKPELRIFIKLKNGNEVNPEEISFTSEAVQTYKNNKKTALYYKKDILGIYYEKELELEKEKKKKIEKPPVPKASLKTCFYRSLYLPGLGQYCEDRNTAGHTFMALNFLFGISFLVGLNNFYSAQRNFDKVTAEDEAFLRSSRDPFATPARREQLRNDAQRRFDQKKSRLTRATNFVYIITALSLLHYTYNVFDAWYYYPLRKEKNINFDTPFEGPKDKKSKETGLYFMMMIPEKRLLSSSEDHKIVRDYSLLSLFSEIKIGYTVPY